MDAKNVNAMINNMRVGQARGQVRPHTTIRSTTSNISFEEVLSKVQHNKEISFSKHAAQRLKHRNITLSHEQLAKLNTAIDKADKKGVKEALILMDKNAFIAHIKNRTIITATSKEQLTDNVFTNIDGAVIM